MTDALDIPSFLDKRKGQPMPAETTPATEKKKRTVRPDAIVATITIRLPVDKKAINFFEEGAAVGRIAADAVLAMSQSDLGKRLAISLDGPALGKMP